MVTEEVVDDPTLESQFALQVVADQGFVLAGIRAIDLIESAHDAKRMTFRDRDREFEPVELVESPAVDDRVAGRPVQLLIVAQEMLDDRLDRFVRVAGLQPLDPLRSQRAGQIRVFAHVLGVAAVVRMASQIQPRTQDDVAMVLEGLVTLSLALGPAELRIPIRGLRDRCGKRRDARWSAHTPGAVGVLDRRGAGSLRGIVSANAESADMRLRRVVRRWLGSQRIFCPHVLASSRAYAR